MSRLIDIDAVAYKCEYCRHHRTGKCDTWCDASESFILDIPKVPTAYDVEEVINVAREAGAKLCANKCCNNNCDCCVVDDALRDIIDAIRKGGVKNE